MHAHTHTHTLLWGRSWDAPGRSRAKLRNCMCVCVCLCTLQEHPRSTQGVPGRSGGRLGALLGSTCGLRSCWHPLRGFWRPFLASAGSIFGLLQANCRIVGAVWGSSSGFWGRCSFATCPFALDRLSLVSFSFAVDRLSLFDLSMVLWVPGPCGLRAARFNNNHNENQNCDLTARGLGTDGRSKEYQRVLGEY